MDSEEYGISMAPRYTLFFRVHLIVIYLNIKMILTSGHILIISIKHTIIVEVVDRDELIRIMDMWMDTRRVHHSDLPM
jgi:hypothetical protein